MTIKLLTPTQVCETLQIGRSKFFALTGSGALPSLKLGRNIRVRSDHLDAFIEGLSA